MKKIVLFLLLLPHILFAQESNLGNWMIYFGDKKINKKLNWHHEAQFRNYNAVGDLEQLLLRTGLGLNLTEGNNNLLAGYAFIRSDNYLPGTGDKVRVDENRIYQQFINRQNWGRLFIQHRYRFEQRFIEQDFKLRFRYFLAFNLPLNNKEMLDKTFYLSAYNEIFLNSNDQIFDRNRLYGGLGYRHSKTLRFELGYMNQFLGNGNNRDQINIISFVNF